MQEQVLNNLMLKFDGKVPDETLPVIKQQLMMYFKDYDLVQKETHLSTKVIDIQREVREYLVARKIEGLSNKTLTSYLYTLNNFIFAIGKPIKEITTQDIRKYLWEVKTSTGIKDISLNNIRTVIKAFYKWLVLNDYVSKNPVDLIKPIKCEKNTRHSMDDIELEQLRAACTTARDKAMVELLYSTAARVSELAGLKISDVNFESRQVTLFGKGRKYRTSFLNVKAVIALKKYLKVREGDSDYIFLSERKPHNPLGVRRIEIIIHKLGVNAGIEDRVYPHRIRRTSATTASSKGMPIQSIQFWLGHEDIGTTRRYIDVSEDAVKIEHNKFIV